MRGKDWVIGYAVESESPTCGTWRDTRLGGLPLWPPGEHPDIGICPSCNRERVILLQAFAPHVAHSDRVVMLFACNSSLCSQKQESWFAFRAFRKNERSISGSAPKSEGKAENTTADNFVSWDTDSEDEVSSQSQSEENGLEVVEELLALRHLQISKKAEGLASSPMEKHGKKRTELGAESVIGAEFLKTHFVEVAMEPKERCIEDGTDSVEKLLHEYRAEESAFLQTGEEPQWDAEIDNEADSVKALDEFRQVIERAPEQVLRYKFGGEPVWPSYPVPDPNLPSCPYCGGAQVFELQLLGSVLFYLKPENAVPSTQEEAGLNFMALGLYTCEKDCEPESTDADDGKGFIYRTQEIRVQHDVW